MYIGSEKQRRDTEVLNAWQTLTNAEDQPGSGGRIKSLEFLNASPRNKETGYPGANWRRRASCLWICTWDAESLEGINLSAGSKDQSSTKDFLSDPTRIYLRKIHLPGANLRSAILENTHLEDANLQDAILDYAHLKDTH